MKHLYIYFGVLIALLFLPGGTDAAKLAPAQVVSVETGGEQIVVRTDLGNLGEGTGLVEAFSDLENTTSAKVFLDTADYLLVDEGAVKYLAELKRWLKGDCRVCLGENIEDLAGAGKYLDAHLPGIKLKDCRGTSEGLPYLTETDERFCLKG